MLIGGNKSTGIRASTAVPTMAITKQQTMMKYGFLIANPDISTGPLYFPQSLWGQPDLQAGSRRGNQSPHDPSGRGRRQFPPDSRPPYPNPQRALQGGLASSRGVQSSRNRCG